MTFSFRSISSVSEISLLAIASLCLVVSSIANAQESVLYDIDFSAPTHTLNAKPAVGAAPDKVSRINFGSPTVVSSFGELTDRPLRFTGGSAGYDQIQLNGYGEIETFRLEFDLVIESLKGSGTSFTVFLDVPTVRPLTFDGRTNRIESSSATWEEGRLLHCVVFADFRNNRWEARLDGNLLFSRSINATALSSIRFSLGSIGGGYPNVKVAVDNIQLFATKPITPDMPTGLSATGGVGASAIKLSWSSAAEADYYRIYRGVSDLSGSAAVIANTSSLEYSDSSIPVGQTYYYWVTAVRGAKSSPFGLPASARIDLAPPASLTVSGPERSDGILLSWPATVKATGYRILRGQSSSFASATWLSVKTSLTHLDQTAAPGIRYYYWVESLSDVWTSMGKATGSGVRGLTQVTNLEATAHQGSNRIDLMWSSVQGATGYKIYRGETDDFDDAVVLGTSTSTEYSDLTAENNVRYHYWVTPFTSETEGSPNLPASGLTSHFQPDLWLDGKNGRETGRGVLELPESDIPVESARNRSSVGVKLWVDKLGEREGPVALVGVPGNRNFDVRYHLSGNVTAEVIAGRLKVNSDANTGPMQILIQPSRNLALVPTERSFRMTVRGTSQLDLPLMDQASLKVVSLPKRIRKPVRIPTWTRPSPEDRAN